MEFETPLKKKVVRSQRVLKSELVFVGPLGCPNVGRNRSQQTK